MNYTNQIGFSRVNIHTHPVHLLLPKPVPLRCSPIWFGFKPPPAAMANCIQSTNSLLPKDRAVKFNPEYTAISIILFGKHICQSRPSALNP
jgi:hypothetical protein